MNASPSIPPHAVLASVGTDGDLYPFLSLGEILAKRGYRVTLATHEHFGKKAAAAGLGFRAIVSNAETDALLQDPRLWHPSLCAVVIARWGSAFLERQYHQLKKLAEEPNTFLVSSIGVVAARLVQEKMGTKLAGVLLQPWMVASDSRPPVMTSGLTLPRWAPAGLKKLYWRGFDAIGGRLVGRELNRVRASLGLPAVQRVFRWWLPPQLIIGLFPDWYGLPQPDWPPQLRLAGFGSSRHQTNGSTAPEEALRFCESGPPPVAFTFGTGMRHAKDVFAACLAACESTGQRALLLTQYREQLPEPLPPHARWCSFAPLRQVLPKCSMVVHHGGIGTTGDALASGTPQLILPFAFDQLDNALRVQKLGAGTWLKASQRTPSRIGAKLRELMSPAYQNQARACAAQPGGGDGLAKAADLVAQFYSAGSSGR